MEMYMCNGPLRTGYGTNNLVYPQDISNFTVPRQATGNLLKRFQRPYGLLRIFDMTNGHGTLAILSVATTIPP